MLLSASRTPRDLTFFEALLPILAGAVVLGLSFALFGNAATSGPLQTALGVATFACAPYALFNLASPLVTMLFAWAGVRMLRTDRRARQAARP